MEDFELEQHKIQWEKVRRIGRWAAKQRGERKRSKRMIVERSRHGGSRNSALRDCRILLGVEI